MGNSCQAKYRNSSEYASMEEDGAPYYKPRTYDSRLTAAGMN
jgi:hypothetical protein